MSGQHLPKMGFLRDDYVEVEDAGHGDMYWFQQPVIDRVVRWFKEKLAEK